jgi:hypothetical protein
MLNTFLAHEPKVFSSSLEKKLPQGVILNVPVMYNVDKPVVLSDVMQ